MEEGYEADYWLGIITSAAPNLDCSTDTKLNANLDFLEKELRAASKRVLNIVYFNIYCTYTYSTVVKGPNECETTRITFTKAKLVLCTLI